VIHGKIDSYLDTENYALFILPSRGIMHTKERSGVNWREAGADKPMTGKYSLELDCRVWIFIGLYHFMVQNNFCNCFFTLLGLISNSRKSSWMGDNGVFFDLPYLLSLITVSCACFLRQRNPNLPLSVFLRG